MVTTNVRVTIMALAIVAACKSEKKRAYERVAREVNPIFTAMKPKVPAIMLIDSADTMAVVKSYGACLSRGEDATYKACLNDPTSALKRHQQIFGADAIDCLPDHEKDHEKCVRDACRDESYEACLSKVCENAEVELSKLSKLSHETCRSADDELWQLRNIKFDDYSIDPLRDHTRHEVPRERISNVASQLLDRRSVFCNDDGHPPHTKPIQCDRIIRCSEWCLEEWTFLLREVELLRRGAKDEGVEMVSLTQ